MKVRINSIILGSLQQGSALLLCLGNAGAHQHNESCLTILQDPVSLRSSVEAETHAKSKLCCCFFCELPFRYHCNNSQSACAQIAVTLEHNSLQYSAQSSFECLHSIKQTKVTQFTTAVSPAVAYLELLQSSLQRVAHAVTCNTSCCDRMSCTSALLQSV